MRLTMLAWLLPSVAFAVIKQPTGTVIPTPVIECDGGKPGGLAVALACACTTPGVCNLGAACPGGSTSCDDGKHGTCETTVWHNVNDDACVPSNASGLDPVAEASITPETFRPTCPLTFTVVTRGGAIFGNAFGWYNVTGAAPAANDLHVMLDCHAKAGDAVVLDVKSDPNYKGGDIGFFLLTPESHTNKKACDGGDCCATVARFGSGVGYVYKSERGFNPDVSGASSFIHLLTYNSHITPRKFYFAWEDIYGGSDNEFTDLVTSVQGVECSGAGTSCDTGMKGACAQGVSHCALGALSCAPVYTAQPEVCDGLDNDCNGVVDDGAQCPDDQLCQNGACVPHCSGAIEFRCVGGAACDDATGLCVEAACAGVTCPSDKVCKNGACVGGCDGVVCPHGQVCRLGTCLDPCKQVSCPMGQVCAGGLCVPGCGQCDGLTCESGQRCDAATGTCRDASCATPCGVGTFCQSGQCADACAGAKCPDGRQCQAGECVLPAPTADAGAITLDRDGGTRNGARADMGCHCDVGGRAPAPAWLLIAVALGLWWRQRRSRDPKSS